MKFIGSESLLDSILDDMADEEKIKSLTKFLENPTYPDSEEIDRVLVALNVLITGDDWFKPQNCVEYRKHLMNIYLTNKKNNWGVSFGNGFSKKNARITLKFLKEIIKGWGYITDYSVNPHKEIWHKDANKCFKFVCKVFLEKIEHPFLDSDEFNFQKKVADLFRETAQFGWNYNNLDPWILEAPELIALTLLKQRTRLGGKEIISEIKTLYELKKKEESE